MHFKALQMSKTTTFSLINILAFFYIMKTTKHESKSKFVTLLESKLKYNEMELLSAMHLLLHDVRDTT